MKRGGRPPKFSADESISVFFARRGGQTLTELARLYDCDPDTIAKAVEVGEQGLRDMVNQKGLHWTAGRWGYEPSELMAYL